MKALRQAREDPTLEAGGLLRTSTLSLDTNATVAVDVVKLLREGTAAMVVPVFEYIDQADGEDQRTFPQDKQVRSRALSLHHDYSLRHFQTLLRLITSIPPVISSFHASWAPGHNRTDYARYYSVPPGTDEVYRVTSYQSAYEPYVIMSKHVPW